MTTERDPGTRIVLSWLREDAHENAERVLLRALDEVDATPQRRSRWPARRSDRMNRFTLAMGAAAVIVLTVVGYNLLPVNTSRRGPARHRPRRCRHVRRRCCTTARSNPEPTPCTRSRRQAQPSG